MSVRYYIVVITDEDPQGKILFERIFDVQHDIPGPLCLVHDPPHFICILPAKMKRKIDWDRFKGLFKIKRIWDKDLKWKAKQD